MKDFHTASTRPAAVAIAAAGVLLSLACSADNLLTPASHSGGGSIDFSFLPPNTTETLVADGLQSPTSMGLLPDGRVLVNEQCGNIRMVKNGALLSTPFLTLTTDCSSERGILGVVADPNFPTNGKVYVYYTVPTAPVHNRISSFSVSGDQAVAGSETILFDLDNVTAGYHNGGAMHFGPDGKLYVGVGENGTSSNSQTLTNVLGKMLRLNPDGSIPTDNPFFNTASGKNRAIWAMGLRNPWTFAFQPGTGKLFIDDVGENTYEEINLGVAGANYGWPTCEGPCVPANPAFRDPFFYYQHGVTCAITGGTFYNPQTARLPSSWVGKYFYADYCDGAIHTIDPTTASPQLFSSGLSFPVDLQVSADGYLYYLQRTNGNGQLWRVGGTSNPAPTITVQPGNVLVTAGQPASFTVAASGSGTLTYQWQRGTTNISGATSTTYTLQTTVQADSGATFRCVVTNASGSTTSNSAVLSVTPKLPPNVTIVTPTAGTTYQGGQVFTYSATATDGNTGTPLPASAYTWQVVFHHDQHTHPFIGDTPGVTSGSFTIPTIGEVSPNVYYAILLTVTDGGLSTSVERDILPKTSTFTIASTPSGAMVTLDGQPAATPVVTLGVVGIQRAIGAVTPQTIGSTSYVFGSWSDAGAATHNISTAATNQTYTVTYTAETGTPVTPSVKASSKTYNGLTVARILSCSLSGNPAGVTCTVGSASFATATAGKNKPVTAIGITLGGVNAANYFLTSTTASAVATINPKPVAATVVAADKPFDGTTTATISSCAVTGNPAGVTCTAAAANFADAAVGAGKTVTATGLTLGGSNAGNYVLSSTTATTTASITLPTVTASVTASSKTYNGLATARITGCTLAGNPSGVTCSAAAATFDSPNAGVNKTVTATGITLGGANAANYQLTSTTATTKATINKLPVGAHIVAANKVFDGTTSATITSCTVTANPPGVLCVPVEAHFATASVGTGKTVTATGLSLTGTNAGNYVLTGTTATTTADITAAPAPPVAATGRGN